MNDGTYKNNSITKMRVNDQLANKAKNSGSIDVCNSICLCLVDLFEEHADCGCFDFFIWIFIYSSSSRVNFFAFSSSLLFLPPFDVFGLSISLHFCVPDFILDSCLL